MAVVGLVGCGGFGREVMPLLEHMRSESIDQIELFFVDTTASESRHVDGFDVLTTDQFFALDAPDKLFNVAIANSSIREMIAAEMLLRGARPIGIRSVGVTIPKHSRIAEGSILCSGSIITSNAKIGKFFHCNIQSYVAHDVVIGSFVTFAPRVACNGSVDIEDHVFVGTGACIKPGGSGRPLRIGRGARIGMGAVVLSDIPPGETWVGNPAKRIS